MGKYRDAAIVAHNQELAEEEAAEKLEEASLVSRARSKAAPLWTDSTGKLVIDPLKETRVEETDKDSGLVILSVLDDSLTVAEISFAVYPDDDSEIRVVSKVDGVWQGLYGDPVESLEDVGKIMKGVE